MSLTPKNWAAFQHYKDRSPAWIKLHRGLLDDFTFHRLPLASKALAPFLWLLASEYEDGKITATFEEMAYRFRLTEEELNDALEPLINTGFFIDDSGALAERKQDACLEREIEEEREKRKNIRAVATATRPSASQFEIFWKVYPKRDGANPKAPARKAFDVAVKSGADPGAISAGAQRYSAELAGKGQIGSPYVAQARTWLNQRRWEDYPADVPIEGVLSNDEREKLFAELRRKPNADAAGRRESEGNQLCETGGGARPIPETGQDRQDHAADDQTRNGRVGGLGEVLRGAPGFRAIRHEAGEVGPERMDDGPGNVAR